MRKVDPELKEHRRRQILDAALRSFREKGFTGASMADICKAAGMSPGHVYHYFSSKDEIVSAISEADRSAAAAAFEQIGRSDDLLSALLAALDPATDLGEYGIDGTLAFDVFAEAGRNPEIAGSIRTIYQDINSRLAGLIREHQNLGKVPAGIDPKGAALAITAMAEGLVVMGLSHSGKELARAAPSIRLMLAAVLGLPASSADVPSAIRTRKGRNAGRRGTAGSSS